MKMHETAVKGFFDKVQEYLDHHSIYRGKAFNGAGEFIDTAAIDPSKFVFTEQVWATAETFIFSVMHDQHILAERGYKPKRAVLLSGDFGGGKTGMGDISAKSAVAAGWTVIFCRPGQDDPFEMIHWARLYGPCLLFIEDVDTIGQLSDERVMSRLLDAVDGSEAKHSKVLLVMTTNHADKIHAGMFRPGRIDTEIVFGPLDRPGVEKLAHIIVGQELAVDVDFDKVYAATAGYMPAFVAEGMGAAVRFSIARNHAVETITTDHLVKSLNSLRPQWERQEAAKRMKRELPPIDQMLHDIVGEHVDNVSVEVDYGQIYEQVDSAIERRIDGARIYRDNGDEFGQIATS